LNVPPATDGLVQQLSFDEAPQVAARPWQLGGVAVHAPE